MKTKDFIRRYGPCTEGAKWALSIGEEMADVWDAMIEKGKRDWLIWTATRPGVFSDSILRKLACRFVRETPLHDGRKVWDLLVDERSRRAVEVAEAYADGKATYEELEVASDAAYDAGVRASAYAARDAAAYAADAAAYAADAATFAAVYAAASDAAYAARDVAYAAVRDAAYATYDAAYAAAAVDAAAAAAAYAAAKAAQAKMIAEMGNPFKKERTGR